MSEPGLFTACHHISREVADVEASLRFYRDLLGFEEIWRPAFSFDGAWLFNYGVQIHLIKGDPPQRPGEISTRADHVAFHTANLQAVEDRLTEHNIPYRKSVQAHTGTVQLFFHDPDGNHIEVGAYPPPRRKDEG